MRKIKCKSCGQLVDVDKAIKIKERIYVCSTECKQKYNAKSVQPSQKNKDNLSELKSYIAKLYDGNVNWPLVMKQLKSMQEDYGYKNSGILYTLKYAHDIKEMQFNGNAIGIVPYLYNEARNFYNQLETVKNSLDNVKNLCYDTNTIVIKKKQNVEDVLS